MVAVLFVAATCFAQTPATTTAKQPVRQEVKKADDATQKATVAKRDSVAAGKNAAVAKGNATTAVTKPEATKGDKTTPKVPAEKKAAKKTAKKAATQEKAASTGTTAPTQKPKK